MVMGTVAVEVGFGYGAAVAIDCLRQPQAVLLLRCCHDCSEQCGSVLVQ